MNAKEARSRADKALEERIDLKPVFEKIEEAASKGLFFVSYYPGDLLFGMYSKLLSKLQDLGYEVQVYKNEEGSTYIQICW